MRMFWLTFVTLVLLAICLGIAKSHEWYPNECCNVGDCRPVACADLTEETRVNARGFEIQVLVYTNSGKKFFSLWDAVRPSPDEKCHACFWRGTFNMRCVFMPQVTH